ncbi:MAG TPA: glycosyltransferase, partial [Terricaulis sp.]|nr:glycosyltransferase [Terricaulis sp.]
MSKLVFLATEDWFVRSHFLPLLRRAQAEGYDVAVAARDSGALSKEGVRVIPMPFARGSLKPLDLLREVRAVRALLKAERPALLHVIAMKPIALALAAGAQGAARAFALTGRGYAGVSRLRHIAPLIARGVRGAVAKGDALLVENDADRAWVDRAASLPADRVIIMPGAGVDPARFPAQAEPDGPFVVGAASRLIWSKGLDLLVEAVRRLNAAGRDIRLHIAGAADPENPESVSEQTLAAWRAIPGVELKGRVSDLPAFWAQTHVACFPTRGGEGLPRALLEAASCGRALIVTNTPGCVDFVQIEREGLIVPTENADALAQAIAKLADGPA